MSTIGSLSTSTSSSVYSGSIGGLASGLDTDAIIEGMTMGTVAKINKQLQNKTLLGWQTTAYRDLTSKLISFSDKYLSSTSDTNLSFGSFFGNSVIDLIGKNSDKIEVSGTLNNNMSIDEVKNLASDATITSSNSVSNPSITSGAIDFGETEGPKHLSGTIEVEYDNKKYEVKVEGSYKTSEELTAALNAEMKNIDIGGGKNLSEVMSVDTNAEGKMTFKKTDPADTKGLKITNVSPELGESLGLVKDAAGADLGHTVIGKEITSGGISGGGKVELLETKTFAERMNGQDFSFNYNGSTHTIKLDFSKEIAAVPPADEAALEKALKDKLQTGINKSVGENRIQVDLNTTDNKLSFKTVKTDGAGGVVVDNNSTLVIGGSAVTELKIAPNSSNKVNLDAKLSDSNINGLGTGTGTQFGNGTIIINGTTINLLDGEVKDTKIEDLSINTIMKKINASDAGVKMQYTKGSDKFTITSTIKGESGNVTFGTLPSDPVTDPPTDVSGSTAFKNLFLGKDAKFEKGEDAIIVVDYDGEGGAGAVEIKRSTNTFEIDGLTIKLNGTFSDEAVKIQGTADTEKITSTVKDMINDYNELVDYADKLTKERKDRDYSPLTADQKKEMTEDEIKTWESKAKEGILYGDSDIVALTQDLRFIFLEEGSDGVSLEDMGITTSTDYKDNGKIIFDEDKFKSALADDPDKVANMFTNSDSENPGIMDKMQGVVDKFAGVVGANKGIFVAKAGHENSASSMLKNELSDGMEDIDSLVETLNRTLAKEKERYQKEFTALEMYISQMNSQSSWLYDQAGSM